MKASNKLYAIYLSSIAVIASAPLLAPILLKLSENQQLFLWPARAIYFIYSFTCHQFAHRSLHLFDYQFAWCARDTGIWLGVLLTAIYMRHRQAQPIPWYWMLPFVIPIALDGGIQTIATMLGLDSIMGATGDIVYVSNNFTRFVTGAIFGIGMSMVFSSYIADKVKDVNFDIPYLKTLRHVLALVAVCIVAFAGLVQAWAWTSPLRPPSDALDSAVKTPPDNLFARREHGACPTPDVDPLAFDC